MPKPSQSLTFADLLNQRDDLLDMIVAFQEEGDDEQVALAQYTYEQIVSVAIDGKIDNLAFVLKHKLPGRIEELKEYAKTVQRAAKFLSDRKDGLVDYLKHLHATGRITDAQLQGAIGKIAISNGSLSVDDTEAQPASWGSEHSNYVETRVEYRIDKRKILADYKAGILTDDTLPPGITIVKGSKLTVKIKE